MRPKTIVLTATVFSMFFLGSASWSKVFADEQSTHQSSSELGVLGQVSLRHLAPSIGAYVLFLKNESSEAHASAWVNPLSLDIGVGAGTLHALSGRFWLGWEISAEMEHENKFLGLGPVLELEVVRHRLHTFLKVPVGWEHSTHHERLGWATIVGLTVAVWH